MVINNKEWLAPRRSDITIAFFPTKRALVRGDLDEK
jgi:hypothetical protein